MKTSDDTTQWCAHCTIAPATHSIWCADCVRVFRAEVLTQRDMRDELVLYYEEHNRALSTITHDLRATLDAAIEPPPYQPAYESLDAALAAQLASEHPSGAGDLHAHASEAGMCARSIYYRLRGTTITNPEPTSALIKMAVGTALHPPIARAVVARYARVLLRYEQAWDEMNVSGHADLHYVDAAGEHVVCEIKTMDTFAFAHIVKEGPKRDHILQASLNAHGVGATKIHLVYVNVNAKRGDSPTREYVREIDAFDVEREMVRMEAIVESADLHVLAPRHCDGETLDPNASRLPWQCEYCRYRERCRRDGM